LEALKIEELKPLAANPRKGLFTGPALRATHLTTFLKRTITEDWQAALNSLLASFPTNLFTAFSVLALAALFEKYIGPAGSWGYVAVTSTAAVLIGYASYLLLYYALMGFKERKNPEYTDQDGAFKFKEFFKLVGVDFTLHLPNDAFTMLKTGSLQGGMVGLGGMDLFWSIITSQTIIDVCYCFKESLYWTAAKDAKKFLQGKQVPANSDLPLQISNSDVIGEVLRDSSTQNLTPLSATSDITR
jgi:hypothetical protein